MEVGRIEFGPKGCVVKGTDRGLLPTGCPACAKKDAEIAELKARLASLTAEAEARERTR